MIKSVSGQLWTQDQAWDKPFPERLNVINLKHNSGLSRNRGYIHGGGNSGYQAINLAYHFGATRIILLGYDMKTSGQHFFGVHNSPGLNKDTNYSSFIANFRTINPKDYGIEIINCSRDSDLDCFSTAKLEDVI